MKSIGTLLACLLASITWSHGQTNGGYTNFIRQKQLPSGVEWDMTVAAAGESQSALAINPGGAQFELWSINTVTAAEYVLDSRYVGSYVPIGGVVILWWSVTLCRQASGQLLDVTSSTKHEEVVRRRLEAIDDVRVADLHVWELGPGRRSCIVSVVTATPRDLSYYRDAVLAALPVAHLTIEIHRCELPHGEHERKQESAHQH